VFMMEQTLKVTNVFSDPTRFNIYQFLLEHQDEPVTVLNVAEEFDIHPNVARLHLSKLEEINMVTSHFERTGKGGRPSKLYLLSDNVIELNFPHRDYKMLSSIAIETLVNLGNVGIQALYDTGKKYGQQIIEKSTQNVSSLTDLTIDQKIALLEDAATILGMYPQFHYDEQTKSITFHINNCPFKEVTAHNQSMVCHMHHSFIKGMFNELFTDIELIELENMFDGCANCKYVAKLSIV